MASALVLERVIGAGVASTSSLAQHPTQPGVVAYCCGALVVLYDYNRKQQLSFLRSRKSGGHPLATLAFSPDGGYLAVGERAPIPEIVVFITSGSGRCIQTLKGQHKHGIGSLAFSADGAMQAETMQAGALHRMVCGHMHT